MPGWDQRARASNGTFSPLLSRRGRPFRHRAKMASLIDAACLASAGSTWAPWRRSNQPIGFAGSSPASDARPPSGPVRTSPPPCRLIGRIEACEAPAAIDPFSFRACHSNIWVMRDPVPCHPAKPCPICGQPSVERFRPFCSRRCADIDLSRWLSGSYAIPSNERVERDSADPEDD
jgi:uncharacterized protein